MARQGLPLTDEAAAALLACYEAGERPKVAAGRAGVHVQTAYRRYRLWKREGKPYGRKPPAGSVIGRGRVKGDPPDYRGPDWIGKGVDR